MACISMSAAMVANGTLSFLITFFGLKFIASTYKLSATRILSNKPIHCLESGTFIVLTKLFFSIITFCPYIFSEPLVVCQ